MRRHAAELVEVTLDRSGATPGLIDHVRHLVARAALRSAQQSSSTAGLVSRVPLRA